MIRLDSTMVIQAVLSGAVATTQPQATACFSDKTASGYAGGSQRTALNSTTDVAIVSAPAAATVRDVDYLSIYNRDTASITLTVKYDISAVDSIILTVTLATLEALVYTHAHGWQCLTSDGKIKVQTGTGVTSVTFAATPTGIFDVSGSPITSAGTITLSLDNQSANQVLAGPASGAAATPGFRALVDADIPFDTYPADGRLTLTSATPVMTSDVSNSTSIYYTPYIGNAIALYDGTSWEIKEFTELTNTTTDNTKNPAAVANNSNYDLFVWNDSGTLRLGRGPAWTSDTARGTGAGTTELERVDGVWVNKIAITNGAAAQRGRYVGTVRSDGSATIDWELGGTAAGGDPGFLFVWNMYNRVLVRTISSDSTDSWTLASVATRASNNSTSMRCSVVTGMVEDFFDAYFVGNCAGGVGGQAAQGIGYDSVTTYSGLRGYSSASTLSLPVSGRYSVADLGYHFFQAIESAEIAGTATFVGDAGVAYHQNGLLVFGRM